MNKDDRKTFDRKVLRFVRAKGSVNANQLSRHMKCKWETADRSLRRLGEEGHVFYHKDIKLWSIWADGQIPRYSETVQTSEEREKKGEIHDIYVRELPSEQSIVRGDLGQVVQKQWFVCHPKTKGKDVPREFVRGHLHGQYFVDVKKVGMMPETFAIREKEVTGGWMKRKMNGNQCYYGHILIPDDDKQFKVHCMSNRDGEITGLSVYVHPRYIYHVKNHLTASAEFRQQVIDILDILRLFGWDFGGIYQKGTYSMALNDPIFASHVPVNHIESNLDELIFDSSPMTSEGGCTEAEILYEPGAEEKMNLMVELPSRFIGLERTTASMNDRMSRVEDCIVAMSKAIETNVSNTNRLLTDMDGLTKITEFNTSILLGNPVDAVSGYHAIVKGDVMYG